MMNFAGTMLLYLLNTLGEQLDQNVMNFVPNMS